MENIDGEFTQHKSNKKLSNRKTHPLVFDKRSSKMNISILAKGCLHLKVRQAGNEYSQTFIETSMTGILEQALKEWRKEHSSKYPKDEGKLWIELTESVFSDSDHSEGNHIMILNGKEGLSSIKLNYGGLVGIHQRNGIGNSIQKIGYINKPYNFLTVRSQKANKAGAKKEVPNPVYELKDYLPVVVLTYSGVPSRTNKGYSRSQVNTIDIYLLPYKPSEYKKAKEQIESGAIEL